MKVAEKRREREVVLRKTATFATAFLLAWFPNSVRESVLQYSGLTFKDFDLSLSQVLVGLNRLIPLTEEVEETYRAKKLGDDEVFKPANINIDSINIYIENTLNLFTESAELGPETKSRLIDYLEDIKLELAEDTPQWKKSSRRIGDCFHHPWRFSCSATSNR